MIKETTSILKYFIGFFFKENFNIKFIMRYIQINFLPSFLYIFFFLQKFNIIIINVIINKKIKNFFYLYK